MRVSVSGGWGVYVAQQGRYDEDFAVRLYKSTDYGKTFRSIAGNLPGGPMNMIREDPVNPNVLYTANDFGVYVTTNGGARWEVLGGNLPSVAVMDFIVPAQPVFWRFGAADLSAVRSRHRFTNSG